MRLYWRCYRTFCAGFALGFWALQVRAAPLEIPLITYYDYPPFFFPPPDKSLSQELAESLTAQSQGRFHFTVQVIPKGRLDTLLKRSDWQGLVAWINPKFVYDEDKTRYIWSDPLINEIDYVAFKRDKPFAYRGPESLHGLRVGMIVNQRYADVEDMVARGALIRQNAPSQENVVGMLMKGRVDVIFMSKSTLSWFRNRHPDFELAISFSPTPRNTFTRHVMIAPGLPKDVIAYVLRTLNSLNREAAWLDVMKRFHIRDQMP